MTERGYEDRGRDATNAPQAQEYHGWPAALGNSETRAVNDRDSPSMAPTEDQHASHLNAQLPSLPQTLRVLESQLLPSPTSAPAPSKPGEKGPRSP